MLSIKNIIRGWYNLFADLVSNVRYKKEFEERYEICKQCDDNRHGVCKHCNCILKAKTKAEDESCPIGKWKTIEDTING